MSLYSISEQQAEKVAREFLQQQYSMIMVEKTFLEDEERVWVVEVLASLYDDKRKINVKVNARTGSILGWQ
ncbi:MAG: PepSY domain-containing protein [Thaumarchaeota archaeon]|nr:MAG: PepSY domain-containing protein [Nitrososphaerota archaeon]